MTTPIKPQLTASYVPGRDGDLDLPEVISPLPQRTLPKFPSNMQEGLARLELETNQSRNSSISSTGIPLKFSNFDQTHTSHSSLSKTFWVGFEHTNQAIYQSIIDNYRQPQRTGPITFNPFPRTQSQGPSVPLSAEEKGELLEKVRHQILKSIDPEIQLAWAQDALLWVDIENEYASRMISENQPVRSITPKLEREVREDAVNIVKHLGEQGHPKAEFIKAYWAEFGKFGYPMDKKESFICYTRAAEKGFARAHYRIGMQYENSGNPIKAMEHYRRGVALHDSASHYRLGMMTLLGQHGTPVDYSRAVSLLRFAAETADENSPQGAYVYGMLVARELPNISVPEQYLPYNIREARKIIEKAAYLGFSKAQVKMGLAYELCQLDCEFDPALSLHYNTLASRQGEAAADMAISKWFLCGYEDLFEKDEKLAFIYAQRAAATELPMAEFAMGYFYEIGMYVTSDLHESERWYKKAAEHGNADALERITNIKANNVFSLKDHEQIAVNRIKSRYGSQRGERPDRFRKPPSSLPTVKREQINTQSMINSYGVPMPIREDVKDTQKPYVGCDTSPEIGDQRNSYPGTIPPKVANMNNSPANPLNPPSNSTNRPVSIAPYPLDDTNFTTYAEDFHQGSDRPHSAFGVRQCLIHAKTEANFRENPPRSTSELRPSSSLSTAHTYGGQSESSGNRLISAGRENQQLEFRTPAFQNQGLQNRLHKYVPNGPGPYRLQKPASSPNMNRIRPPQHPDDYHGRPTINKHESSMSRRDPAVKYPLRTDRESTSNLQQIQPSSNNQPRPKPQQNTSSQSRPSKEFKSKTRPLPSPPGSSSVTAPQPKKTGPATFEEMGIPAANKEGECSVM
ncbi:Protein SKT5 [Erysiphe neolycopersici]|uniref:Protein SKT5 n=1 Tax=Erysiphe neolycopersici TaxID=212602 RepID=A0A420I097_9PEZI|nr:Protein SKT5 [Erysiphe neolycopersici]